MRDTIEIELRGGADPNRIARGLSDGELHSQIAACERAGVGAMSDWRQRFYQALLAERYLRPPILDQAEAEWDLDEVEVTRPTLGPDDGRLPLPLATEPQRPGPPSF